MPRSQVSESIRAPSIRDNVDFPGVARLISREQNAREPEAALNDVLSTLRRGFGTRFVTVFDVTEETGTRKLVPRASEEPTEPGAEASGTGGEVLRLDRATWAALDNGTTVRLGVESAPGDFRRLMRDTGTAGLALLPVHLEGNLAGTILALHGEPIGEPTPEREAFERTAAHLVGTIFGQESERRDIAGLEAELLELRVMRDSVQQELHDVQEWKKNVFSTFSHEFQTPLYTLLGFSATLIENEKLDEDREIRVVCLQHIYEQASRLETLVKDMLFSARLQDASQRLSFEEIDVREILLDVEPRVRERARERTIDVYFDIGTAPIRIEADLQNVRRLVDALLDHALQSASPDGWISCTASGSEGGLVLQIADNGTGIPESQRDLIFEPFYRGLDVHAETTGTALGLSIVKDIVDLHGGFITVESKENEGSTFTVVLPRRAAPPPRSTP